MSSKQYLGLHFEVVKTGTNTDTVYWANETPHTWELYAASMVDAAGITAHASNNATVAIELNGTEVASETTSTADTGDIAAGVREALVKTSAARLAPGELLEVLVTKGGSGVDVDLDISIGLVAVRDIV